MIGTMKTEGKRIPPPRESLTEDQLAIYWPHSNHTIQGTIKSTALNRCVDTW